jgi:hypothetical protein
MYGFYRYLRRMYRCLRTMAAVSGCGGCMAVLWQKSGRSRTMQCAYADLHRNHRVSSTNCKLKVLLCHQRAVQLSSYRAVID